MHAAVGSLLRRGLEVGHAQMQKDPQYKLPTWGIVILAITAFAFFAIMSMVEYTFGRVIPALVMIESPEAILFEPLTTEDPDAPIDGSKAQPELLLVKQKPITSSFRSTIQHLQSKGGFRARFRGISAFVVYSFAMQWVSKILSTFIPFQLSPIIASVICAQLSLTWTHIVISEASPKPWYRRVPSMKTWKKVAIPSAILALAEQVTIILPAMLATCYKFSSGPEDLANSSNAERQIMVLKAFSVFVLGLVCAICVVIPANITLTRVQASLLPDSEETIVPFDRSFGGKVVPEIVGGSGVIGILDAGRTFDWNGRVRLYKTYAKVLGMQIALTILFTITLTAQLFLIVGKDMKKLIPSDGQKGDDVTIF